MRIGKIKTFRVLFKLDDMLEHPKALSTNSFYIISENLKDKTMDNQQGILTIY
jgi:hypothetical protein